MLVRVANLEKLPRRGYYALWLTKDGRPVAPCGNFVVCRADDRGPSERALSTHALRRLGADAPEAAAAHAGACAAHDCLTRAATC